MFTAWTARCSTDLHIAPKHYMHHSLICSGVQVKQGERFDTATDTEVIPKLCKYVYNNFTRSVTFSQVCPTTPVQA